jgi:glutathione S-transferase
MTVKLYTFPLSPRSFKVLWAANHAGVDFELKLVDFTKGGQTAPDFVALNPNGRAPVLEENGYVLWESNAIVEYLAAKNPGLGLLPPETPARLQATKWLYWESAHFDPACAVFAVERVVKALFNRGAEDPAEIARGNQLFERAGKVLDGALGQHRYVAGDTFTVADLSIGAAMCIADQARFPIENFRGIQRWLTELKAMPSWVKTRALQVPPVQSA